MKKQLLKIACGLTVLMISLTSSFAQGTGFYERRLINTTVSQPARFLTINTRINRAFIHAFENATYMRWFELGKNFLVKFALNGQENRALFTKNGQMIYHISYGTEKHLPADVRRLVKSSYFDQEITRTLKITQDRRLIWVISMEDDKDHIMVRVEDNELEETERMEKTK